MPSPFFSVVIPTFNRCNIFPLAVRSVLAQTFPDFEVIVSDNCSTDDSAGAARQFTDPRFKYVRTPEHVVIADSWEFARRQGSGKFTIMLSDDDALVDVALERFAAAIAQYDADFLFSDIATYRDPTFPGVDKNSMDCPRFSGTTREVSADEFVRSIFAFRPKYDPHPSAFAFSREIADRAQARTGRFFWTNGVEFSAWPISAVLARKLAFIDLPLVILGRTGKSWGSNTQLCNPGKDKIQAFFADVDQERKHAPLKNFTTPNLMAEGMLTAKSLFPAEFANYEFDEVRYLRATVKALRSRQAIGVDVEAEMNEALGYAAKYPALVEELKAQSAVRPSATAQVAGRLRTMVGNVGVRAVRQRIKVYRLAQRLDRGDIHERFSASGEDFGFSDILGCAGFLSSRVMRKSAPAANGIAVPADRTIETTSV